MRSNSCFNPGKRAAGSRMLATVRIGRRYIMVHFKSVHLIRPEEICNRAPGAMGSSKFRIMRSGQVLENFEDGFPIPPRVHVQCRSKYSRVFSRPRDSLCSIYVGIRTGWPFFRDSSLFMKPEVLPFYGCLPWRMRTRIRAYACTCVCV